MIHVVAKIEVVPGKRDAFLDEFHRLVPEVLAEEGCVEYGPTIDAQTDLDSQQQAGENVAVIIERWESLENLKTHLGAAHMLAYRERVKDLVVGSRLEIYTTA